MILAAILGILAIKHPGSDADIATETTFQDAAPTADSIPSVSPVEPTKPKNRKKLNNTPEKPAETPRRHLDDIF